MSSNWKSHLQRLAREHKMCAENRAYLNNCDTKEDAIRIYKQTIDWALEEGYPNIDFLRKEFADQKSQGLYIDHNFDGDVLNEHQVYVFHNCTGTIKVGLNLSKKIIPMCYFANGCDMNVLGIDGECFSPSRVPLYIFGDNKIKASDIPTTEFRIYQHNIKEGGKR